MTANQDSFQFRVRRTERALGAGEQGIGLASSLVSSERTVKRILRPPAGAIANSPDDPRFGPLFDWAFRRLRLNPSALRHVPLDGQPQTDLVLFNVLVALEWTPDKAYLAQLESALQQASDLLYDVTDGYMAIGQVVVGGPELIDYADIQILASNRFYPRTSVNGLTELAKYQPIRLGRGLWDKQQRHTNSWDDLNKLGPQTIVHEWGHYALGMKDRYFKVDSEKFVVPALSPVENTIMADVKETELSTRTPQDADSQDASDWDMLSQHPAYKDLGIVLAEHPNNRDEPLIPVPAFHVVGGAQRNLSQLRLRWEDVATRYPMKPEHCWVYVVKGTDIDKPTGFIAQGTIEEPVEKFQLLGAEAGNFVVLVGNIGEGRSFQPLVLYTRIEPDGQPWVWQDATPRRGEGAAFPLVDVTVTCKEPLVNNGDTITLPRYAIRVDGFDAHWSAVTFPLGENLVEHEQDIDDLSVLEGHVMLVSKTSPCQIAIASYSIGGSPGESGFPGHPNPLPAGSAEGNAMLFFHDAERGPIDPKAQYSGRQPAVLAQHYEQFKIVTVTNPLNDAPPPGTSWLPCGYAFSVTSNMAFKTLVAGGTIGDGRTTTQTTDLKPTLVLYYDKKTQEDEGGDLTIGRYSAKSQTWDLISVSGTQHKPRKGFLLSLALNPTTAPGLFAEAPQAEHYRLFRKASAS
jgi:hypothetical protein